MPRVNSTKPIIRYLANGPPVIRTKVRTVPRPMEMEMDRILSFMVKKRAAIISGAISAMNAKSSISDYPKSFL